MNIIEKKCLWKSLQNTAKPILLYGLGDGADKVIEALDSYGLKISGVFCSDELYREKSFHGFKLLKYSTAKEIFKEFIVLMSFGTFFDDVIDFAKKVAKEQEFYVPDVPVFGDGLFDMNFFNAHKNELEWVYSHLADEKSKQVFDAVINFKLSGKAEYLFSCESDNKEAFDNILCFNDEEQFLDLGAYDGDTVKEFADYTRNKYAHITAVEPDRKNFKKLSNNTKDIHSISLLQAAVSDSVGSAVFDCKGGRSSTLSACGKETVDIISVDSLDTPFTYIKMDVEGNELKAIAGARNTLKHHKPKLLISAYHRNEDMFTIPKAVLDINPNYKVYIRHYKYLPAWDTNYYFI